jgi:putative transposase
LDNTPPENGSDACEASKAPGHAQRFLSVFGVIASFFRPGRHLLAAVNYREIMRRRFTQWRELVCLQPAT